MVTRNKRGDATLEYLIILAIMVIIALIISAFMGWLPGFAGSLKEHQSSMFWSSAYPLKITNYEISTSDMEISIQNIGNSSVQLIGITTSTATNTSLSPTGIAAQLTAGQISRFTVTGINCSSSGVKYELYNFSIYYSVMNENSNSTETSSNPLFGTCQ